MSHQAIDLQGILSDDKEALGIFLECMKEFNRAFCDMMASKKPDWTLKLEVRGDKGQFLHCRVDHNSIARPKSAGKKR